MNELAEVGEKKTLGTLLSGADMKDRFNQILGKRAVGFMSNILSIANSNTLLKNADPMSIISSAMLSATLDLPINQNLGFAYIVPYNQSYQDANGKWQKKQVATFQIGYKGFLQLAQRSGQFKTINAIPIHEGQVLAHNLLKGIEFDFSKTGGKVVGYAAYFELINGFEKTLYMSNEELDTHAKKYSQTYKIANKGTWKDNFEAMAIKTVLKLLLSKYAPLSVDMQTAQIADQAIIKNIDGSNIDVDYIDNQDVATSAQEMDYNESRMHTLEMILKCDDILELESLKASASSLDCKDEYNNRLQELMPS
jgi:recombination protein RecT